MEAAIVKTKVVAFLRENGQADALQGDEQDLIADGVIDSFGLLNLISFAESEFQIAIDTSELDPANFNTVSKIAAVILKSGARGL